MPIRSFFIIFLFTCCAKPAFSQFFQIFGPSVVDLCSFQANYYAIETSGALSSTTWTIVPTSANIFSIDPYTAEVVFFAPGSYILFAVSLTPNGTTLMDSFQIYVNSSTIRPEIIGCYVSDTVKGCYLVCAFSKTIIQFPGSNDQFAITGAESYIYINPGSVEIMWGAGGQGTVTTYHQGCINTLCFDILPEPHADFSTTPTTIADTLTVCKNQEIFFDNQSFHGLTYTWNFGDGDQIQSYDANHSYDQEGFYNVILTAESICSCGDEKQIVVQVLPAPAPTLDCVNSVCPETRQRYTATTNGCTQYFWSISSNGTIVLGGGPADDFIEVIWHEGPDGFIELSVSNCSETYCSFTNTFRVPIITPDGPIEGDASVCAGEITTYSASYFPGTQYQWQIGSAGTILGGQNTNGITVQWANVNMTTSSFVEVEYNNCFLECQGSDVMSIAITPQIKLTGNVQVCENGTATVNAEEGFTVFSPVNVGWHIENASGQIVFSESGPASSFTHTFNYPPGEYAWVATNTLPGYCTEVIRLQITVSAIPISPLGIRGEQIICPGQPYGYTIESAGPFATLWTVIDGSSTTYYTGQSFQHTFGSAPPYSIQAVHADIQYLACVSGSVSITLGSAADLNIAGPDEECLNGIYSYTTDYISGVDYSWEIIPADHGEIKRSNLNDVDVFWTQTGNATLRLHACGVSIDKSIFVHPLPVFNVLGPLAACANELVRLTTDQPLLAHTWVNSNEDIIGILNNIQLLPGSFGVELTDGFGCTNEKSIQIESFPAPTVHLSSAYEPYFCATIPGGVEVVANTDGGSYSYTWFLDDIEIGPGGPVFNVNTFGAYHVEIVNSYGCKAVSQKLSFLNCCAPSICGLGIPGAPGGCEFIATNFSIAAAETDCNIHQYSSLVSGITPGSIWWFIRSNSEGVIAAVNMDALEYNYQKPGYYHITMLGLIDGFPYNSTSCGHFENLTDTVRAVADFSISGICAGDAFEFKDLTTFIPGETINSWNWDFGDPTSGSDNVSSLQHPIHIFSSGGTYEVTLTVNLTSGCSTSKKQQVIVSEGPVLLPLFDMIYCENEAMAFELPGEAYDIVWDFGDPLSGLQNTAVSDSVLHTFDLPGLYNVTLAASDINNCRSQTVVVAEIKPNNLGGLITVDPNTPLCAGDTATLTAPPGGLSWLWSNSETLDQIVVTESNQYNVLIRDQDNCTYSPPAVFVEVYPKPEVIIKAREILGPNQYGPWASSLELCFGTEFEIQAFSTGNVSYQWSIGSTFQILQFTTEGANLPGTGLHEFSVITTDMVSGCISDTTMILIEIYALPSVPVISLISGSGCSFNDNEIQITNPEAGVTYEWSDGQNGISIITTHAGAYNVTALNQNGCTSLSNTIFIVPSAPVDQIPAGCFIACDPLMVCLPLMSQVSSYTIYHNGAVFQSGNSWPGSFMVTDDGSYTIEVTTFNGCTAVSDPLDVLLYPGVGSITVLTYFDTDGDGMIGPGDALLPGIPIQIVSDDGLNEGMTDTDGNGEFVFQDYPSSGYTALIDRTLLPSQWMVLIDSVQTQISTCGDSVVVSLLITNNCLANGPDQYIELCPGESINLGDSTWTDTGTYVMHMNSVLGCDSIFQVIITIPDSLEIGVTVWVDLDHDGVVSPSDTVIQGILIVLDRLIGQLPYIEVTDINGNVSGQYPSGNYLISIDSLLLPAGLEVVYGVVVVSDTVCGLVTFNFLISSVCPGVFVIQQEVMCPGDSLWIEGQWISNAGLYSFIHSDTVTLCDTLLDVYVSLSEEIVIQSVVDWNCQTLGSVMLDVSGAGPFSYVWSNGMTGDTIITGLDAGNYFVTVGDANGCNIIDTFLVVASNGLVFDIPALYTVQAGDSVLLIINGDVLEPGLTFEWTPIGILSCSTCATTLAYAFSDTTIFIEIRDADSCLYLLETQIVVLSDTNAFDQIYVPNIFSPNGDGINDRWTIFSRMDNTFVHELSLHDRWGTMIFSKTDFVLNTFEGWDGTFRGKEYNQGVFVYKASLTLGDGRMVKVKGDVTLIR